MTAVIHVFTENDTLLTYYFQYYINKLKNGFI